MKKYYLFIILLLCSVLRVSAQVIQGIITDDATGEPLTGAHVFYIEDKSTLKTADINGHYSIAAREGNLQFSMMGFVTQTIHVSGAQRLNVKLKETATEVKEVEIKVKKQKYSRKNNPAVEMMKKVIAAKSQYDLHDRDYFSYRKYTKLTTSLNEFTEKVFEDDHFKHFPMLKEHVERCPETGKLIMPLMVDEKVTRHIYRKDPKTEKDIIEGHKESGVNELMTMGEVVKEYLGVLMQDVNVYDNNIRFFQTQFISPLSSVSAIGFYRYFITDTLEYRGDKCYKIDFTPNNAVDVGFMGSLYVLADSSWRVRHVELGIPKMSNVNWIEQLDLYQDFITLPGGEQVVTDEKTICQLRINNWLQKAQIDRVERYMDFDYNPIDNKTFKFNGKEMTESAAEMRDDVFWEQMRPVPLTQTESKMDLFMKRLEDIPGFKYALWVLKAFIENYVETSINPKKPSKFDFGPINTTFAVNDVEGFKLRLSGYTTAALNPHLFASGYLGYGFKDQRWKGQGVLTYSFNKKKIFPREFPVNNISAEFFYDVITQSDRFIDTDKDNIVTALKWTKVDHQAYVQRIMLKYDREWKNGLRIMAAFRRERMEPTASLFFQPLHSYAGQDPNNMLPESGGYYTVTDEAGYKIRQSNIKYLYTSEFQFAVEYQPGVTWLDTKDRRRKTNFDSPMFRIAHSVGVKGLFGADYNSNLTEIAICKRFWLGSWGRCDVNLFAQGQWNQVPFPLLCQPVANLSYIKQKDCFYLIDNLEFITDRNASLILGWEMGGKLFNRIPLIKKLKWREFIGANLFWGYLTDKNNPLLPKNIDNGNLYYFPGRYDSDGNYHYNTQPMRMGVPYAEVIVGIHNIFRILHIEYVHRLNYYRSDTQSWGIRFTFQMFI